MGGTPALKLLGKKTQTRRGRAKKRLGIPPVARRIGNGLFQREAGSETSESYRQNEGWAEKSYHACGKEKYRQIRGSSLKGCGVDQGNDFVR